MKSSEVSNINSKYCVYGCNTKIYWNTLHNEYSEVTTEKKHFCPNRLVNSHKLTDTSVNKGNLSKPVYYNNNHTNSKSKNSYNYKKSWPNVNNKQPMDNSLEILQGSPDTVVKQYEVLTDLIKEFTGKTHGSQSHCLPNNSLQIVVYYEIPEGMRGEIKKMFWAYTRNEVEIHQ